MGENHLIKSECHILKPGIVYALRLSHFRESQCFEFNNKVYTVTVGNNDKTTKYLDLCITFLVLKMNFCKILPLLFQVMLQNCLRKLGSLKIYKSHLHFFHITDLQQADKYTPQNRN